MEYKGFYITYVEDICENTGGYFCQVYLDSNFDFEIDNFCIHKEDLISKGIEDSIISYIDENKMENLCFNCGKIKEDCESAYCDKCWEAEEKRLKNEIKYLKDKMNCCSYDKSDLYDLRYKEEQLKLLESEG